MKPNIVFILLDNVGWGDIGCYGGLAPTPRIDALASQGLRFKNYNVEAQCTPTRSAILTGRLPIRTGNCSVPLPGQGHYGLAPWEYTLGELFSDAGYATAAFGKWHVGDIEGRLPTDQGFDEWFGIKNTSDESGYSCTLDEDGNEICTGEQELTLAGGSAYLLGLLGLSVVPSVLTFRRRDVP